MIKENNNIDGEVLAADEMAEIERTEEFVGQEFTEDKDPTADSEENLAEDLENESQDDETDSGEEMFEIEEFLEQETSDDEAAHEVEDQEEKEDQEDQEEQAEVTVEDVDSELEKYFDFETEEDQEQDVESEEEQEEKEMSDEQAEANVEEDDEDKKDSDPEEDDDFPEIDLDEIEAVEHPTKSAIGSSGEASDLRIIKTTKNGNRVVAKEKVINVLGLVDTVQLGLIKDKKTLVMCKDGIGNEGYFLRKQNKTYSIYNKALVEDITEALGLDFSKVSTINLDVKYTEKNGKTYLMARKQK